MEELFLQLWAEVARLRELCSEQGRLLQRLRARKGPVLDIPVSLPIQCTEDAVTGEGRRSPESPPKHPGAPASPAPDPEGSAQPTEQPRAASSCPPSPGNGAGTAGTAVLGSSGGLKGDVPTWMGTWILPGPREGARAPCSPQGLETLNPGAGGSFPNLLDLYEAPAVPEREDAPRDGVVPVEAPVEIRGPVKTSWTPGWALEEGALGPGPCGAAPACDLCREIFPSDAAGHAEYLNHVLAHLE